MPDYIVSTLSYFIARRILCYVGPHSIISVVLYSINYDRPHSINYVRPHIIILSDHKETFANVTLEKDIIVLCLSMVYIRF